MSFQIVQDRLVKMLAEVCSMQLYCLRLGPDHPVRRHPRRPGSGCAPRSTIRPAGAADHRPLLQRYIARELYPLIIDALRDAAAEGMT